MNKLRGVLARFDANDPRERFYVHVLVLSSVIGLLIASLTVTLSAKEPLGRKELSQEQARTIVLTFLKSQGYKTESPKFDLENDPNNPDFPGFCMFHAYYDTATRLNSIGTYAVNRKTTALWERVGCEELKSKALEQLQNRLRRKLGLSESEGATTKPCF